MTDFNPELRLTELGLTLPPQRAAVGNYVGAAQDGNLVLVAGMVRSTVRSNSTRAGWDANTTWPPAMRRRGWTILSALSSLKSLIGDLNRVQSIMRVYGMVNSVPEFERHPEVIDGASIF